MLILAQSIKLDISKSEINHHPEPLYKGCLRHEVRADSFFLQEKKNTNDNNITIVKAKDCYNPKPKHLRLEKLNILA